MIYCTLYSPHSHLTHCIQVIYDCSRSTKPAELVKLVSRLVQIDVSHLRVAKHKLESFEWIVLQENYNVRMSWLCVLLKPLFRGCPVKICVTCKIFILHVVLHEAYLYLRVGMVLTIMHFLQKESRKKKKSKSTAANIKNSPICLRDGDTLGLKVRTCRYNAYLSPFLLPLYLKQQP